MNCHKSLKKLKINPKIKINLGKMIEQYCLETGHSET